MKIIYIIMDYYSSGDLLFYFEYHDCELPEAKTLEIVLKLSISVFYLNSYGIVHIDLKP